MGWRSRLDLGTSSLGKLVCIGGAARVGTAVPSVQGSSAGRQCGVEGKA